MDDVPVRHTASFGGLYGPDAFEGQALPFDSTNPRERELRLLIGNVRWMRHRHYAYIGTVDEWFVRRIVQAKQEVGTHESLLQIVMVPGDHLSGQPRAMRRYLDLVKRNTRLH